MTNATRPFIDETASSDQRVGAPTASRAGPDPEPLILHLTPEELELVNRAGEVAGAATPAAWVRDALVEMARAAAAVRAQG